MDTSIFWHGTPLKATHHLLLACVLPRLMDTWVRMMRLGQGSWLRKVIEHDTPVHLLYGPAGTGKTTLARTLLSYNAEFVEVSAITGNSLKIRREIEAVESRL